MTRRDDEPTLTYESSVAGALAPGERVLWEDHPHLPPPRLQPLLAVAAIVLIPTATAIIAAAGTHGNVLIATLAAVVVGVLSVIGVIVSARNQFSERADLEHVVYRFTDRRVIRSDSRPRRPLAEAPIASVTRLTTVHGPRAGVTIYGVEFTDLADADVANRVLLRVLGLWARSGRRRRVRRVQRVRPMGQIDASTMMDHATVDASNLPAGIVLASGEKVLWIGRPRVRDPLDGTWVLARLKTLAWLLIPTVLLLWSLGIPHWVARPHWAIGAFAVFWMLMSVYGMTLEPLRQARRRARTVYILTNVRTIQHEAGAKARTNSNLLDMVGHVHVNRRRDGAAELWIGSANFTRVPASEVDRVHAMAIEAVRAAGVPPEGMISPDEMDDERL